MGEIDNTLVFYIVGDNGASAEGGTNGMFNEYTYFNGVEEKVPDLLKVIDKWGSARDLSAHGGGMGRGVRHAFHVDEAGGVVFRRHPQRNGGALAEGHPRARVKSEASSTT